MKHITFTLLAALLLLGSCRKRYTEPHHSPREEHLVYYSEMQIDTFHTVRGVRNSMVPGSGSIVFEYSNRWGVSDDINDNEYYANVRFPVSSEQTSFSYSDAQLATHLCYFEGGGAWGGYGFEELDNGVILGNKNADGSWEISIVVTLKGVDQRLQTSHIVKKGTFRERKL